MKKLYAKWYLRITFWGCLFGCCLCLYGLFNLKPFRIGAAVFLCLGIVLIALSLYRTKAILRDTWIQYGKGKVVVCRPYKGAAPARKSGKRRRQVDVLDLSRLEEYGFTAEVMADEEDGVEQIGMRKEILFVTVDGQQIPVELWYFTKRQRVELIDYVDEYTEIAPMGSLENYL